MGALVRRAGEVPAALRPGLVAALLTGLLTGLLALGGCGAAPGAGGGASPSPPPPGAAGPGQLTNADSGRTVQLRVGQTVELVLRQEPGFSTWQAVQTSNPAVLTATVDTRAAAVRGVTLAAFRASAPGRATVTASAGVDCSPGSACPSIARAYAVTVVVGAA